METKDYKDGYTKGYSWDSDYYPGGPWRYTGHNKEIKAETQLAFDEWHRGFKDGYQDNPNKTIKGRN